MKLKIVILCVIASIALDGYAMQDWRDRFSSWLSSASAQLSSWSSLSTLPSAQTMGRAVGIGAATAAPAVMAYAQGDQNYGPYSCFVPGMLAAAMGGWLNRDAGAQGALASSLRWSILPLLMGSYYYARQKPIPNDQVGKEDVTPPAQQPESSMQIMSNLKNLKNISQMIK